MVRLSYIFISTFTYLDLVENTDFLGWSFAHEDEIKSCLSFLASNSAADGDSRSFQPSLFDLADLSPLRWIGTLRSQFVQAHLCTDKSLSCLEEESEPKEERIQSRSNGDTHYLY